MAIDVGGVGGRSILDVPVRRALEQARWPWHWGPPYTFPGNPPIAQELSETFRYQPQALDYMRTVPVEMTPQESLGSPGMYYPREKRIALEEPYRPYTAAHEYGHAWSNQGGLPRELRPEWLAAYPQTRQLVPSSYKWWERPAEALAYATETYAPLASPVKYPMAGKIQTYAGIAPPPAVKRALSGLYDWLPPKAQWQPPSPLQAVQAVASKPDWNIFDIVRASIGR